MEKGSSRKLDETTLISLLQQRDQTAFEYLYDNYAGTLLGVITRIVKDAVVSEDVLQEAFIRIWKKIHAYDPSKGRLFTWMVNICRNLSIDTLRSKEFKYKSEIQSGNTFVFETKGPTDKIREDHIGIMDLLNKLSPEQKEVMHLIYYLGFTQSDAAKELNLPLGTVKSRVRLALKQLRKVVQ